MGLNFYPNPGCIVTCRKRQWIVLPSTIKDLIQLRPLSGNENEICGIYQSLGLEEIESAQFPLPNSESIQDHNAAKLLADATKLSLRNGAGPFRCLGRLSVRPRPYQLVPLLMALRLDRIRLLIADDVGIGKTIEAGLIAKEMLDRGEIKRLGILCPPHLCDQWQKELQEKFHIDAVVVRSGTVGKLERSLPSSEHHIFSYYPHIIVSLDYAKSDRRRGSFLAHCPDFIIVDEAHTCSNSGSNRTKQQQRHQLIQEIAKKVDQHLLLLTATPHSGIEESFLSILGLLNPKFAQLELSRLTEKQRVQLATHFIQRRRADVKRWLGNETPFPEREPLEQSYKLSKAYQDLFNDVYAFARGLVITTNEDMSYAQRRGRYWSALALIRCVMSSPAAAIATLAKQLSKTNNSSADIVPLDDELLATYLYDLTEQEQVTDAQPTPAIEQGQRSYQENDRRKLRGFIKAASQIKGKEDSKLQETISTVKSLLKEGFNPIIWCRFIATANYVAQELKDILEKKKNSQIRVIAITGELSEDEREARLEELTTYPQRILVATDCLSEGVNLQEHFQAVIHYDLPWNPNRLEQREGRIDRYGQTAKVVKSYLLYGQDNPVDGAVLDVLIRKAVTIHKTLGITVPVPMDSETVSEAVFKSLFDRTTEAKQLSLLDLLDEDESPVEKVHKNWDRAIAQERESRTRFAQRAIKPAEVEQELIESDTILGNEEDVERFVKNACIKFNCSLKPTKQGWIIPSIPKPLQPILGTNSRQITFTSPAPEGVEYIGRNHSLVEGLARYIFEDALETLPKSSLGGGQLEHEPLAARCGFTITDVVAKRTTLLLLRARYLLTSARVESLLAEESLMIGFTGSPRNPSWLELTQAQSLLKQAEPVGDLAPTLKKMEIDELLANLDYLEGELEKIADDRAKSLLESHRRVRNITKEGKIKVQPQLPMDILGVYVLQPGKKKA